MKDILDKVNEVFPNFLIQLSKGNNPTNDNINNNNINETKKENPLMVLVGEDPTNINFWNDNSGKSI